MGRVKIICPSCKQSVIVEYRTIGLGHSATDEALAIHEAIKKHNCRISPIRERVNEKG